MFRKYLLGVAILSLVLTGTLLANHHTYVNAMKAAAKVTGPTGKAIEAGDMDTVKKNANIMNRNYTIMAAWWEGRGSAAAFKLAESLGQGRR